MRYHQISVNRLAWCVFILAMYPATTLLAQQTPPAATTNAASGVTAFTAALNGTVNANNDSTQVRFQYGLDTNYGRTVTANPNPVAGVANTAVNAEIGELTPNTTYHFRVVATNSAGTTYGDDLTFTTSALAPAVTTGAASGVSGTGATLNGIVNANNASTTVTFEYGPTTGYGTTVTADESPVTGMTATAVSKAITGLTAGTTYHYRVVGQNDGGTSNGSDQTFTAGTLPAVTTNAASGIGAYSAVLNGTINANGTSTTSTFEYGLTTAYGREVTASQSPVTGSLPTAVSAAIDLLIPNSTYHFRAIGENSAGRVNGADLTFTTSGLQPVAITGAATGVTNTGATLHGVVQANNAATTVTFQYGLTTAYGTTVTATESPVNGVMSVPVSRAIGGLTDAITYHYRVVAQNSSGTTYGDDQTFLTGAPAPAATTEAATGIGINGAILNGTVNANGTDTIVEFQLGLTTAYGLTYTAAPSPVSGSTNTPVSYTVTGLLPGTTFHYRVAATNGTGTTYGADATFVTDAPEINIRQLLTNIPDGTGSYDFGEVEVTNPADAIFTVQNPGTQDLTLGTVILGGTDSGEFSVQQQPNSTVAPGGSTTFTIRFAPSSDGPKNATLSLVNNDGDENPYNFTLQGTGFAYFVSGTVTNGFTPIQGVTLSFSHDSQTETSAADGTYSRQVLAGSNTVITADHPGYTGWIPANYTIEDLASSYPDRNFTPGDDTDGVSAAEESGPGGNNAGYDGNSDGVPDRLQPEVASLHTAGGQYYVTLAAPAGTRFTSVQALAAPAAADGPPDTVFPWGQFSFILEGVPEGGSADIQLFLPAGAAPDGYWKNGPETGLPDPHWYSFLYDSQTGAEFNANVVTLHFIDGQRGDDNLAADTIIPDAGGPTTLAPIPVLSWEGLLVLLLLLPAAGWWVLRRQ